MQQKTRRNQAHTLIAAEAQVNGDVQGARVDPVSIEFRCSHGDAWQSRGCLLWYEERRFARIVGFYRDFSGDEDQECTFIQNI